VVPVDGEGVSPNASEPVSASLHYWRSASLPDWVKPDTGGEATDRRIRWAARGDWGERMPKELIRYPGDPPRGWWTAVVHGQGRTGSHNRGVLRRRKSDRLVVAEKRGNARGAKGPNRRRVFIAQGGTA